MVKQLNKEFMNSSIANDKETSLSIILSSCHSIMFSLCRKFFRYSGLTRHFTNPKCNLPRSKEFATIVRPYPSEYSTHFSTTFLRSILIIYLHLRLGLSSGIFYLKFPPHQNPLLFSTLRASFPAHLIQF